MRPGSPGPAPTRYTFPDFFIFVFSSIVKSDKYLLKIHLNVTYWTRAGQLCNNLKINVKDKKGFPGVREGPLTLKI
jgi:hypothetical protein